MSEPVAVDVHILDKDYRISCPEEEREALIRSARFLDRKMRDIRQSGKVIGIDRIAVMAALNIAHELLNAQANPVPDDLDARLAKMAGKIEMALKDCQT